MNSYKILNVNRNTSEVDIKKTYKQLAKKYHPDLNKEPGAKDKFIEIKEAYMKLINPEVEPSFMDSIFGDNESGINFYNWESMVKKDDFNIPSIDEEALIEAQEEYNKISKIMHEETKDFGCGRDDHWKWVEYKKTEISKKWNESRKRVHELTNGRFKEYNWARNKTKIINKIFRDNLTEFNYSWISTYPDIIKKIAIQGIKDIIIHLNRVLAKEVDVKEKIKKVINPIKKPKKGYYNESFSKIKTYQKLIYNTMKQYHPKFLNKLPMAIQIHINKVMRHMTITLEKVLEDLNKEVNKKNVRK